MFTLLKEVGELRLAREAARGGVSLPLPEQEIDRRGRALAAGVPHACCRSRLWNAQISLLTGFGAASLMVYARVGLLRTLPPADPHDVQRLHRTARALGIEWPAEQLYPDFIRALDVSRPAARGDGRGVHPAAARQRVRRLQRRPARAAAALRAGLGVRPRDGAAAPAGGPLRPRDLRRALRRRGGARLGAGQARDLPDTMRSPAAGPTSTRTPCSTSSRRRCSPRGWGSRSPRWWWRPTRRTTGAATLTCRSRRSRRRWSATRPLPVGEDVTLTLTKADVATRSVQFTLE